MWYDGSYSFLARIQVSRHQPYFVYRAPRMVPPQKTTTATDRENGLEHFWAKCDRLLFWMSVSIEGKGPTTWSNRLHLIVWYDWAKYTENFTGKNGHFPLQGGAHFNLEELENRAIGSMKRVLKTPIIVGNNNTHQAQYPSPYFH